MEAGEGMMAGGKVKGGRVCGGGGGGEEFEGEGEVKGMEIVWEAGDGGEVGGGGGGLSWCSMKETWYELKIWFLERSQRR
jgi:hypothetical protein